VPQAVARIATLAAHAHAPLPEVVSARLIEEGPLSHLDAARQCAVPVHDAEPAAI
jgi:hypothetical protein